MRHSYPRPRSWFLACVAFAAASAAVAQPTRPIDVDKARVIEFWTPERRAAAIPRDLFLDSRGLPFLRHPSGYLQPYGHTTPARSASADPGPSPFGKPTGSGGGKTGGSGDTTGPTIGSTDPVDGGTVSGTSKVFAAQVSDPSGVASVTFQFSGPSSDSQTLQASRDGTSDTWFAQFTGLTNGSWAWTIVAKDKAPRGGNTSDPTTVSFSVEGAGSPAPSSPTVSRAEWSGGAVQTAAGRLLFTMGGPNSYYVCSGTVVTDQATGRSLIMTAAHCVYDDSRKAFADNVMFIPNQAGSSSRTDLNCGNDPLGCWVPSYGVVDRNWATRTFPYNRAWDYAFYVVSDSGAHLGASASSSALDELAGSLPPSFADPRYDVTGSTDYTHALGYSYSDDPKFMYCAEDMTTEGAVNWWLSSCGLTGGASGGPWVQPMDTGTGPIISVNSWGYVDRRGNPLPGMAGPKLNGTSARCVFDEAKVAPMNSRGVVMECP